MRFVHTQRYRGHVIRRTWAGFSVESAAGVHITTVENYQEAIQLIDARLRAVAA